MTTQFIGSLSTFDLETVKSIAFEEFTNEFPQFLGVNIIWDNSWHYLDRFANCGYIANAYEVNGYPKVTLVFNSFKEGGFAWAFKQSQTLPKYDQTQLAAIVGRSKQGQLSLMEVKQNEKFTTHFPLDEEFFNEGTSHNISESAYLESKGFKGMSLDLPRLRLNLIEQHLSGALVLIAQISDIEGKVRGYQQFFNSGKYYTPGMAKKGGFIMLGEWGMMKGKREIYICEGLATGLSIYLALGENNLVLCALDAGNLFNVVEAVRRKFGTRSKCPIVIAADNDQWKAEEVNKFSGNKIGNTGIIKANFVAHEFNCKLCIPDFSKWELGERQPTDFNDLMEGAGLEEVLLQLGAKSKANASMIITKKNLEHSESVTEKIFNDLDLDLYLSMDRFLQDFYPTGEGDPEVKTIYQMIKEKKGLIIRSPIGTGKTETINRIIQECKPGKVLYISYLIGLAQDAAKRLGFEVYTDYQGVQDKDTAKLTELQHLSICLNSLPKLLKGENLRTTFNIIVIDEIEQVIRRLTSNIADKLEVILALKELIKNCDNVIVMDAHVSQLTTNTLHRWIGKDINVILNKYKIGADRKILLYENAGVLIRESIKFLKEGKKVFLVSNNKKELRGYYDLILEMCPGKKGLFNSGDNSGDIEVKDFFADVNLSSKKYDFICCTPSVTSGVSVDEEFDFVGGIFTHLTNTPMDALQALGRVRKAKHLHVWLSDVKNDLPTTNREIGSRWLEAAQYDRQLLSDYLESEYTEKMTGVIEDYKMICLESSRQINLSQLDFYLTFVKLAKMDGYEILTNWESDIDKKEGNNIKEESKELEKKEYNKEVMAAELVTKEQAEEIRKKSRKEFKETFQLKKRELVDFFNLPLGFEENLLRDLIEEDQRGKLRRQVRSLEIAIASDSKIQELREKEFNAGVKLDPDRRKFAVERELYKFCLDFLGLKLFDDKGEKIKFYQLKARNYTRFDMTPFVDFLKERWIALKGVFQGLPKIESVEKDPVKMFGTFLKKIGILQKRIRTTQGEYQIDFLSVEYIQNLVFNRVKIPQIQQKLSI